MPSGIDDCGEFGLVFRRGSRSGTAARPAIAQPSGPDIFEPMSTLVVVFRALGQRAKLGGGKVGSWFDG
jgi:hypothetical protein